MCLIRSDSRGTAAIHQALPLSPCVNRPPTNPFLFLDRYEMIKLALWTCVICLNATAHLLSGFQWHTSVRYEISHCWFTPKSQMLVHNGHKALWSMAWTNPNQEEYKTNHRKRGQCDCIYFLTAWGNSRLRHLNGSYMLSVCNQIFYSGPSFTDMQGPSLSKSISLPFVITTGGRNVTWTDNVG